MSTDNSPPHTPGPLTRSALYELAGKGSLTEDVFEAAVSIIGVRPGPLEWRAFWTHLFTLCGTLLLAAGILFFIAWNWADLHHFVKFGILQGIITLGILTAALFGPDKVPGKLGLLLAGITIGPLLAVYGQSYMSGAYLWELFRVWSLALLVLALIGRQISLWLLFWLTAGAWGIGYLEQSAPAWGSVPGLPEFLLGQILALSAWEAAYKQLGKLPGYAYLPRLVLLLTWIALSWFVSLLILDGYQEHDLETLFIPVRAGIFSLYALGQILLYVWYRHIRKDLFMLACGTFSLAAVLMVLLFRMELVDHEIYSLLYWGLIVCAATAACGKLLLYWQGVMEEEEQERRMAAYMEDEESLLRRWQHILSARDASFSEAETEDRDFFGQLKQAMDWPLLWKKLSGLGYLSPDSVYPEAPALGAPWHVNLILSTGGWIAAILLMAFLGFFLFSTLDVGGDFAIPLLLGSLIFLGLGTGCSRLPGMFSRQFGLACALTGSIGAAAALVHLYDNERFWALPCLAVSVAGFLLVRSRSYRFIASFTGFFFLYALLNALRWANLSDLGFGGSWMEPEAFRSFMRFSLWSGVAFWGSLCALAAWAWSREKRWRISRISAELLAPLLSGALLTLPFFVIASLALQESPLGELVLYLPSQVSLGLASGLGLLVFVLLLPSGILARGSREYWFFLVFALLSLPLGWFLPGVALAFFGFALCRYSGNKAGFGSYAFFLAAYIFYHYYSLSESLLYKAASLGASGAFLVFLALILRHATFLRYADGAEFFPPPLGLEPGPEPVEDPAEIIPLTEDKGDSNA